MKVYVIIELYAGDQTIVKGVFSTEDKAKQSITENNLEFIKVYELDKLGEVNTDD
jgi:hypothetical protein